MLTLQTQTFDRIMYLLSLYLRTSTNLNLSLIELNQVWNNQLYSFSFFFWCLLAVSKHCYGALPPPSGASRNVYNPGVAQKLLKARTEFQICYVVIYLLSDKCRNKAIRASPSDTQTLVLLLFILKIIFTTQLIKACTLLNFYLLKNHA